MDNTNNANTNSTSPNNLDLNKGNTLDGVPPFSLSAPPILSLRLRQLSDASNFFRLVSQNKQHLSPWHSWVTEDLNEETFSVSIASYHSLYLKGLLLPLSICYNGLLVGAISLHDIDWQHSKASIGYWIARIYEGRSIVSGSVRLLVAFAFEELNLNKLLIRSAPLNVRSITLAKKVGFRHEGTLREDVRFNTSFATLEQYSFLRKEYEERKAHSPISYCLSAGVPPIFEKKKNEGKNSIK